MGKDGAFAETESTFLQTRASASAFGVLGFEYVIFIWGKKWSILSVPDLVRRT